MNSPLLSLGLGTDGPHGHLPQVPDSMFLGKQQSNKALLIERLHQHMATLALCSPGDRAQKWMLVLAKAPSWGGRRELSALAAAMCPHWAEGCRDLLIISRL